MIASTLKLFNKKLFNENNHIENSTQTQIGFNYVSLTSVEVNSYLLSQLWDWSVAYMLKDTTLFGHSDGIWLAGNDWNALSFDRFFYFILFYCFWLFMRWGFFPFFLWQAWLISDFICLFWLVMGAKGSLARHCGKSQCVIIVQLPGSIWKQLSRC